MKLPWSAQCLSAMPVPYLWYVTDPFIWLISKQL